jgi:hypothetical protein
MSGRIAAIAGGDGSLDLSVERGCVLSRLTEGSAAWEPRVGVIVRFGLAGLLVTIGLLTSSCDDVPAVPPSDPIDELSLHDGKFCPTVLPRAPRETYGFGDDRPATTAPTLWTAQEAWICRYEANDVTSKGSDGAWFEWVRRDTPRRLDTDELKAFSTAIAELKPPPGNRACPDDLGSRYLVSYAYENDLTGVVFDSYGCGDVRLTDDPFKTVPGDASQPGTVAGVLTGPTGFLDELNAR